MTSRNKIQGRYIGKTNGVHMRDHFMGNKRRYSMSFNPTNRADRKAIKILRKQANAMYDFDIF